MSDWETYYKEHINRKPKEQLIRAVSFCGNKDSALDLGAGTLVESIFLLKSNFKKVTAMDSSPQSEVFAKKIRSENFSFILSSFKDFKFEENSYDLINAQYALPFYGKEGFSLFIKNVIDSLKTGGIFVGQFFGVEDEWNTSDSKLSFQTEDEFRKLLNSLEIIDFSEEKKRGNTAAGKQKHWHVFHFIARKK